MRLSGDTFETAMIPEGTTHLTIDGVTAKSRPRLAGLADLPLTSLELRRVAAPDLTDIPLPATLEALEVWQCRGMKSLAGIERAQKLRSLKWWWMPELVEARALSRLPALTSLRLEGGMTDKQRLASLDFLTGLRLEELVLSGIRPASLDLAPVLALEGLKRVSIFGMDFAPAEMARLAARFPALHDDLKTPAPFPAGMGNLCPTCGGGKVMLRLHGRKLLWCPDCEATGLARELERFSAMVEAARQGGVDALSDVQLTKE